MGDAADTEKKVYDILTDSTAGTKAADALKAVKDAAMRAQLRPYLFIGLLLWALFDEE